MCVYVYEKKGWGYTEYLQCVWAVVCMFMHVCMCACVC